MAILTRDQILSANDLETKLVPVPGWGGEVKIQALTGAQRDAFEASMLAAKGKDQQRNLVNIRARLCALSIVDESGNRLFTDADVKFLGNKSAAALQSVFEAAQKLNGMTPSDVEELAGNSDSDQSEDSGSDSQLPLAAVR